MFDYEAILADHYKGWSVIESYLPDEEELTIGTELAAPVASPDANSTTLGIRRRKLSEKIKAAVDRAVSYIQYLIQKLSRSFKSFLLTTRGFEKELAIAKKQTRPLNGIKVIMYNYKDTMLDELYLKMINLSSKFVLSNASSIPQDSPLLLPKDQFELNFIREISGKEVEPGDNFSSFLMRMKKEYRGERKEQVIGPNQLSMCEKKAKEYPRLRKIIDSDLTQIKNKLNAMKMGINMSEPQNAVDERKANTRAYSNATFYCHCCATLANWYFNLKFEEVFQCRAIIKRFYSF